jgi:hypothetical protein
VRQRELIVEADLAAGNAPGIINAELSAKGNAKPGKAVGVKLPVSVPLKLLCDDPPPAFAPM